MNKYLVASIIISGLFLPVKAEILSVHCPLGCPSNPTGNDLVFSHVYALSNNPVTKFADWVEDEIRVTQAMNVTAERMPSFTTIGTQ